MNDLKVLVTGASGFIGAPLVKKLDESGFEVMALSRNRLKRDSIGKVYWLKADLSLPNTYQEEIKLFNPDIIIHLFWQDIPDFSFEKSLMNLNQSLEFLSFILELNSCRKILVSGSCLEYNKTHGECRVSDLSNSRDHFTWAKLSINSWLSMKCVQKKVVLGWFRIFYVYGPKQRSNSLIPTILSSLKQGELPQLKTPKYANDYIFIDDVIDAFCAAVTNEIPSGIYNLGTGSSTSVLDVCRCAEKIVNGSDLLTQKLEKESLYSNEDVNFWAEINTTEQILGWSPKIVLDNGIKQTWDQFDETS